MEFLTPSVIAILGSAVVGLIVKAVRLQTNVDALTRNDAEQDESIKNLTASLLAHSNNADVHFNLRISQEVDKRNEQRFVTIERQLGEINGKLDRIASRAA